MADARTQLTHLVRRDLARAQAAARAQREAAEARLRAAQARLSHVRAASQRVPRQVATYCEERRRLAAKRHEQDTAELAARAARAAEREAPGAASAPWARWEPTPQDRTAIQTALRIGEVRLPGAPAIPALVPLLDHAHLAVRMPEQPSADDLAAADGMITGALLRALGRAPAGMVRVIGYDPEHLGGALAGFARLATAGLLTFIGPGGLGRLLDDLVDHIRRINEAVLAGEYASQRDLVRNEGRRPEPWRVAILLGGAADELSRHEQAQLDRVLRTGVACGVHLIVRGIPVRDDLSSVHTVSLPEGTISSYPGLPVRLDDPPPSELLTKTCKDLAEIVAVGPKPAKFQDLLPERLWKFDSATGLTAPIGEGTDDRLVELTLGDYPPHALIGGPSGTGKTNLIYAWMGALAARYDPSQLEFYLLDFKEGVSFARFAPSPRDPSWLPQVRLVGVNVNTDREFGLALLRFLTAELRTRANAAKRFDVTKLEELRAEDPQGHWPRIVAVVDEFQELLAGRDQMANEVAALLEDLARRGRSQGIHLVLASQDVSGIQALWGRQGLVAQFTLRIALPKARRILHETNLAAESLPRHHAVINADSGALAANRITRIPAASERSIWADLQQRLCSRCPDGLPPPRLFDGDAVPLLGDAPDYRALEDTAAAWSTAVVSAGAADVVAEGEPSATTVAEQATISQPAGDRAAAGQATGSQTGSVPVALLGETIDVRRHAARLLLPRRPGRNLAVLGTRSAEACAVLGAAARSLALQFPPGAARFSVACLDDGTDGETLRAAHAAHLALPRGAGWYDADTVLDLLADTADGLEGSTVPHFLLLYAVDAATGRLSTARPGGSGHQHLRKILLNGPERHVHVLGWWRGVARLRDDLGAPGTARYDTVGAWVALDVHGGELTPPLYPKAGGPAWYPRPWRGLFFDRAVQHTAEVIVPYGLT